MGPREVLEALRLLVGTAVWFAFSTVVAAALIPLIALFRALRSVYALSLPSRLPLSVDSCVVVVGATSLEGHTVVEQAASQGSTVIACDCDSSLLHEMYETYPTVRCHPMDASTSTGMVRLRELVSGTMKHVMAVVVVMRPAPPDGEVNQGVLATGATAEVAFEASSPWQVKFNKNRGGFRASAPPIRIPAHSTVVAKAASPQLDPMKTFQRYCTESSLQSHFVPSLLVPVRLAKEMLPMLVHSSIHQRTGQHWLKRRLFSSPPPRFVAIFPSAADAPLNIIGNENTSDEESLDALSARLSTLADNVLLGQCITAAAAEGFLHELGALFGRKNVSVSCIRMSCQRAGTSPTTANSGAQQKPDLAVSPMRAASRSPSKGESGGELAAPSASSGARLTPIQRALVDAVFAPKPDTHVRLPSIHDQHWSNATRWFLLRAKVATWMEGFGVEEVVSLASYIRPE